VTGRALLAAMRARGLAVRLVDGDRVAVAPRGAVDEDLRAAVSQHRAELLAALRAEHAERRRVVLALLAEHYAAVDRLGPRWSETAPALEVRYPTVWAGIVSASGAASLAAVEYIVGRASDDTDLRAALKEALAAWRRAVEMVPRLAGTACYECGAQGMTVMLSVETPRGRVQLCRRCWMGAQPEGGTAP
jgi:hypothetical protein